MSSHLLSDSLVLSDAHLANEVPAPAHRDTDDARLACSQTLGLVVQYASATTFCLILAFYRDWRVSFVVLATIPIVTFAVALTERFSGPLANANRETSGRCASRVDRIIGAVATVKAFNAEEYELRGFKDLTKRDFVSYVKLHFVWGLRAGTTSSLLMAMFVQGFWYGAYLIRTGQSTASAVNTCFWACMLGSTYLQSAIPLLVTLEKGKVAMAGLLSLARDEPAPVVTLARRGTSPPQTASSGTMRRFGRRRRHRASADSAADEKKARVSSLDDGDLDAKDGALGSPLSPHPFHLASASSPTMGAAPHTPVLIPLAGAGTLPRRRGAAPRAMGKLRPATFSGELSLRNVTFHYPTRPAPAPPALEGVSLYFAARETTYVVGTSGSGKSTVGQLLLGLYEPEAGHVEVDEQGLEWIDDEWLRGHVACVSQGASVLFDGTIHDNVAVGVVGQLQEDGTRRRREDVTRDEVVAACRGALIHDFIRDLPDGYDTWLSGEKGASLSGGQRQRLAIARAWIRDPTVLILGACSLPTLSLLLAHPLTNSSVLPPNRRGDLGPRRHLAPARQRGRQALARQPHDHHHHARPCAHRPGRLCLRHGRRPRGRAGLPRRPRGRRKRSVRGPRSDAARPGGALFALPRRCGRLWR